MDEHTPIDVPIRLEEWDRHDCINEVDTIVIDARPILDATDYDHLPAPDDWAADFIAEQAQRLGLLRLWDGPFTVELPECGEYPAYIEWRGTHKVVEGAKERFRAWRGTRSYPASKGPKPSLTGSWPSTRRFDRDAWPRPKGRDRRGRKESETMTIDELIEQLKRCRKTCAGAPSWTGSRP